MELASLRDPHRTWLESEKYHKPLRSFWAVRKAGYSPIHTSPKIASERSPTPLPTAPAWQPEAARAADRTKGRWEPRAGRLAGRPPLAGWGPPAFPGLAAASSKIPLKGSRPNATQVRPRATGSSERDGRGPHFLPRGPAIWASRRAAQGGVLGNRAGARCPRCSGRLPDPSSPGRGRRARVQPARTGGEGAPRDSGGGPKGGLRRPAPTPRERREQRRGTPSPCGAPSPTPPRPARRRRCSPEARPRRSRAPSLTE